MKKIIAVIVLALSLTFMPACSMLQSDKVQQVSSVVLNGPILISDIERVYDDLALLQSENNVFNEEELEIFEDSMTTFEIVKTEYETLIALEMLPSTEDAMIMWKNARTAYGNAFKIIEKHRDQYSARTCINIDIMDAHAKRADIDVMALLSDPTSKNISQALQIIGGLVNIGAKVAVLL